jgi:hypothetical protein
MNKCEGSACETIDNGDRTLTPATCLSAKWSQALEQQWLQVALKTYFWAGFLFAIVFAVSCVCLAATKYYHDQAVLRHNAMERDFRSYSDDLREARKTVQEVGRVWYAVDQMRKEIEAKR